MRSVLFLDVDGVLNADLNVDPVAEGATVDPAMAALVNTIQADTGCEIVLSSSWRLLAVTRDRVSEHVTFTDVTPYLPDQWRGAEIRAWLTANPDVTRHAILDDDDDFFDDQPLFITEWNVGITEAIARRVTEHLNGRDQHPDHDQGSAAGSA